MSYEETFMFHARLVQVVCAHAEYLKNELDPDDPDYLERRSAINHQRDKDLRDLHRLYFDGKKSRDCQQCPYARAFADESVRVSEAIHL